MLTKDAPNLEELLIQSESLPWREKSLKGISEKMLWRNENGRFDCADQIRERSWDSAASFSCLEPVHVLPEGRI